MRRRSRGEQALTLRPVVALTQLSEEWGVWVKRPGEPHVDVFHARALQTVSEFKQYWISKAAPGLGPGRVALRIARAGAGAPPEDEEAAAEAPHTPALASRATLRGAGLSDGSSLLAVVDEASPSPPRVAGARVLAQFRCAAGRPHFHRQHHVLSACSTSRDRRWRRSGLHGCAPGMDRGRG